MSMVPDSRELLGMAPTMPPAHPMYNPDPTGFYMTLNWNVSKRIGEYFSTGLGNALVTDVLSRHGMSDVLPDLAVHPGGPAILQQQHGH